MNGCMSQATIIASVPAFPAHCTSMRRAPSAASTSTATEMPTSRTIVAHPIQAGTAPSTRMAITPAARSTRSAAGSSTFPTVDTWFQCLAM